MKVGSNNILVKVLDNYQEAEGFKLSSAIDWCNHLSVVGEVVSVPNKNDFYYNLARSPNIIGDVPYFWLELMQEVTQYSTEYGSIETGGLLELEVGDKVLFHYVAHMKAEDEGLSFKYGGDTLMVLPYDLAFLRINDKGCYPLNGWVFVEGNQQRIDDGFLRSEGASDIVEGVGVVKYLGFNGAQYLHSDPIGLIELNVGDTVSFRTAISTSPQNKMHLEGGWEKTLWRIQRKDILTII